MIYKFRQDMWIEIDGEKFHVELGAICPKKYEAFFLGGMKHWIEAVEGKGEEPKPLKSPDDKMANMASAKRK